MTNPTLNQLLESATQDVRSHLEPDVAWSAAGGRRRRRRLAVVSASVAAVVVAAAGVAVVQGDRPTPTPAPSPEPSPDLSQWIVTAEQVLPPYDPADWEELPELPVDLGWWASAEQWTPLEDDPVERATAVVQATISAEDANIFVFGADGRWRLLDDTGLALEHNYDVSMGVSRDSLSPDGTQLAIGQPEGIVVIDLTTGQRRSYPMPGLDEPWTGRATYWTADGQSVLMYRSYVAGFEEGDVLAYQPGWRVSLADGEVTRLDFDPESTAFLGDGTLVTNRWSQNTGHLWSVVRDGVETEVRLDDSAVLDQPTAQGQRWVARRELSIGTEEHPFEESGFAAYDDLGRPISVLPVVGVENNGGGGRVVGWVDDGVALFAMPDPDKTGEAGVVAWDVDTGELWRGPLLLADQDVSVAEVR